MSRSCRVDLGDRLLVRKVTPDCQDFEDSTLLTHATDGP